MNKRIAIDDRYRMTFLNNYTALDEWVVREGRLLQLGKLGNSDDKYVLEDSSMLLYQEHLDGPALGKEEAKVKFPEEFV